MIENNTSEENKTENVKLYSLIAICASTFMGGPIAGVYMMSENFKLMGKPKEGRNLLIIGLIAIIALVWGIISVPERVLDKMPNILITIIITAIVWAIVEYLQGDVLKHHKEKGNAFFSGWRTAGITALSAIILLGGILCYAFLGMDNEVYDKYDEEMVVFSKNENQSLTFYDDLDNESKSSKMLVLELDEEVIPKWEENIQIIEKTNKIEGLPSELIEQNKVLLKYSKLRLEAFGIYKKALNEDLNIYTDQAQVDYVEQLDKIHKEIDEELDKLKIQ